MSQYEHEQLLGLRQDLEEIRDTVEDLHREFVDVKTESGEHLSKKVAIVSDSVYHRVA